MKIVKVTEPRRPIEGFPGKGILMQPQGIVLSGQIEVGTFQRLCQNGLLSRELSTLGDHSVAYYTYSALNGTAVQQMLIVTTGDLQELFDYLDAKGFGPRFTTSNALGDKGGRNGRHVWGDAVSPVGTIFPEYQWIRLSSEAPFVIENQQLSVRQMRTGSNGQPRAMEEVIHHNVAEAAQHLKLGKAVRYAGLNLLSQLRSGIFSDDTSDKAFALMAVHPKALHSADDETPDEVPYSIFEQTWPLLLLSAYAGDIRNYTLKAVKPTEGGIGETSPPISHPNFGPVIEHLARQRTEQERSVLEQSFIGLRERFTGWMKPD